MGQAEVGQVLSRWKFQYICYINDLNWVYNHDVISTHDLQRMSFCKRLHQRKYVHMEESFVNVTWFPYRLIDAPTGR